MYCPLAYGSSLTQFYPSCLSQILGFLVTCGVKIIWLCHGWGWQPPWTASHIHIRHAPSCLSTLICYPWAYSITGTQLYPPYFLVQILEFWVTCGVKMMSLCHGWGWQSPQTDSHLHIRHIKNVWAHWYAVHRHMVAALHSYTHSTWVRFWGSGSLVESKWCHYIRVDADSHLKLLPTSILDITKCLSSLICCP